MEEKDQREVEGRGGKIPLRFIPQDEKEVGEKSSQKKCQKEVEEIVGRIPFRFIPQNGGEGSKRSIRNSRKNTSSVYTSGWKRSRREK